MLSSAAPSSAVAEPVSRQDTTPSAPSFFFPISINAFLTVSPRFIAKEMSQQELDAQMVAPAGEEDSASKREGSLRTSAIPVMQFRHICELPDAVARVVLISRYQNNIFKGDGSVAEGCCYLLSAAEQDLYTHKMKGHLQQQQLQQREISQPSSPLSTTDVTGSSGLNESVISQFLRVSEAAISNSKSVTNNSTAASILPPGLSTPVDYCFTCPISSTAHKSCERFSIVAKETAPSPTVLRVGYLLAHLFCLRYFRAVYQQNEECGSRKEGHHAEEESDGSLAPPAPKSSTTPSSSSSPASKEWLSEMEFYNIQEASKTMLRAQGVPLSKPSTSSSSHVLPAAARFGRHNVAAIIAAGVLQAAKMYRQQPQVNLPFMLHVIHERAVMYDSILLGGGGGTGGTETIEDGWMDQVVSYEMAIFQLVSSSQPLRDLVPPEGYIRELLARMQSALSTDATGGKLPSVVKEVIGRVAIKILEASYADSDLILSGCSTQTLVGSQGDYKGVETMQGEQDHNVRFVRGPISRVTETLVAQIRNQQNDGRVKDPTTKEGESVSVPHGATYDAAVCSVLLAVCGLISSATQEDHSPPPSSGEGADQQHQGGGAFVFPSMVWGVAGCSGAQADEPCIKDAPEKWRQTLQYFRDLMHAQPTDLSVVHDTLLMCAIVPTPGMTVESELFSIAKAGARSFYSRLREVSHGIILQERIKFLHAVSPLSNPQSDTETNQAIATASSVHAAHFARDLVEGSKLTDLPFSDTIILDPKPSGCVHEELIAEPSFTSHCIYNSSVAQKVRGKLLEDSPRLLLRRPFSVPVIPLGGMSEMQRAYLVWYDFYLAGWASALL